MTNLAIPTSVGRPNLGPFLTLSSIPIHLTALPLAMVATSAMDGGPQVS